MSADDIRERFRKARETEQIGEAELIRKEEWDDLLDRIVQEEPPAAPIELPEAPDPEPTKNGNGKHVQDVVIPELEPLPSGQMRLF